MINRLREWISVTRQPDGVSELITLNKKIVRVLRDGLFSNAQDFMELFRASDTAAMEHCDQEVAVVIPIRDHDHVMSDIESAFTGAVKSTGSFFHPEDYDEFGDHSLYHDSA